ncbi:hypothetical protein OEZ85_001807 [Tetradesmus obliquus]|uniref:Tr-type G domain-containing protein n=1 Tax=Tetradesmus obliquus TaxID=3088 RepID=A0ABY8U1J4_TETOB|nr:hypothetical protein OEZ85_001807 [Tetradesmus obliquus]
MRGLIGHRPFLGSSQLQNRAGLGQCSGSCRVAAIPCPQAQQQRLRLHAAAVDAEVQQQAEAATQLEADVTQHSAAAAGSHESEQPSSTGSADTAAAAGSSSDGENARAAAELARRIAAEVARRRNFAIISHPDAGKTTMTEKLLLYGGAIHEAGEVKARANARSATSDFMALEKQRGISISSTAMTWQYQGSCLNLLDTPGHQDFSEDTYRTLAAADNAVLLVDGAKGIEPQTRKLFAVARLRGLPVFTFVNKMDRPALNGFEIIEQLEKEFGLQSYPVTWPIGSGDRFCGVYHRPSNKVLLYAKAGRGKAAASEQYELGDPALAGIIEADLLEQLMEEVELLQILGDEPSAEEIASGAVTPMYFGSAFNNFGVDLFLQSFISLAVPPRPAKAKGNPAVLAALEPSEDSSSSNGSSGSKAAGSTSIEGTVSPESTHFSGLVFKLQANMDPKHRDKVAFVRVVSGKFDKGMKVKVARTGRVVSLSRPQQMFAQSRATVQEGFAGDVIGLTNPGAFAIGDTIYAGPELSFPPIPSFSPELFAYLRCAPNQKKAFAKGVEGLLGEGAVQVLYSTDEYITDPILAAVGQLQFEVVQYRMKDEYGVDTSLEPLSFCVARWVLGGWPAVERAGRMFNTTVVKDAYGRPVLLFRNEFAFNQVIAEQGEKLGELSAFALPPDS